MDGRAIVAHVHISADDPTLTPQPGLLPLAQLVGHPGPAQHSTAPSTGPGRSSRGAGRARGELLSPAEAICVGAEHVAHLEELRRDRAGAGLRTVAEVPTRRPRPSSWRGGGYPDARRRC